MTTEVALFDYEATSTLLDHALVSAWHWAEPKRFSKGAEKLLFPRRTSNISARESKRRKSSSRLFLDLGHLIISVLQIAEVTRHVYYTFHSVCLVHIRSGGVTMVVPQGFSAEQIGKTSTSTNPAHRNCFRHTTLPSHKPMITPTRTSGGKLASSDATSDLSSLDHNTAANRRCDQAATSTSTPASMANGKITIGSPVHDSAAMSNCLTNKGRSRDNLVHCRLFDRLGINAKTALLALLGDPVLGVDVSTDCRWLLAACKTYLLLTDTLQSEGKNVGKLGFEGHSPNAISRNRVGSPLRLPTWRSSSIKPRHLIKKLKKGLTQTLPRKSRIKTPATNVKLTKPQDTLRKTSPNYIKATPTSKTSAERPQRSPKGYGELIFTDAAGFICRINQDFQ
ncbi:uncharacterized protein MYCGRDRAFT_98129 [Zymoseptoria tritici IPO323]|uniref:Vacuolar import/degradation Vid27 C-terminal domain-containing protein n=1 Tax=Zymoseptoria tritici (strain CBS 115943 / IPO323) TaxID=336722 RepID=F9XSD9_ZYMTI|nr:uncharacterized protein MYCGRDRAFT_98129 [Zymoseptoria tritici IPO323]EGP81847.1 hypothetical protein MYCGRDRAFT_98129 [Zymoseptoria tritici IPO323]